MVLVSMNDGIVGSINKLEQTSPLAAASLMEFGLYEALCDYAEANREPITKALTSAALSEVDHALEVAERMDNPALVSKLDEISKSLSGYDLVMFNRRVNRDEGGRFARQDGGSSSNEEKQPKRSVDQEITRGIDSGMISSDSTVNVTTNDGKTQQMSARDLRTKLRGDSGYRSSIESVSVGRGESKAPQRGSDAGTLFDLANVATDPSRATRLSRAMTDGSGNLDAAAAGRAGQRFTRATDGNDRRSYRQMEMLGGTLRDVSEPGSELQMAGALANLVGRLGPEAEAVIGPGVRRTAYRYRGTERRPDANLRAASAKVDEQLRSVTEDAGGDFDQSLAGAARRYISPGAQGRPGARAGRFDSELGGIITNSLQDHSPDIEESGSDELPNSRFSTTRSMDSVALQARGDAVVANLVGALKGSRSVLPTTEQVRISQQSGSQPPSHGVIIDAEGNMVTQAHGFNGDHYLPFDLKNLKALRGGQYVRTRAAGGPTTEDIYTGLMGGARQMQVVSHGGVFSVQFDPDLRGKRRYSDKSRQMVRRYEQILETISDAENKHGLMARDFDPETKADIRNRAVEMSRTPDEFRENLKVLTAKERFKLMSNDDYEEVQQAVTSRLKSELASGDLSRPQLAQRKRELEYEVLDKLRSERPRRMQLNSEGYKAALDTLQAEFPYFIREVKHQPLRDWAEERGLRAQDGLAGAAAATRSDSGYRSPNALRGELTRGYRSRAQNDQDDRAAARAASEDTQTSLRSTGGSLERPSTSSTSTTSATSHAGNAADNERIKTRVTEKLAGTLKSVANDGIARTQNHNTREKRIVTDPSMKSEADELRESDPLTYAMARVDAAYDNGALSGEPETELAQVINELSFPQAERLVTNLVDRLEPVFANKNESQSGSGDRLRESFESSLNEALSWKAAQSPLRDGDPSKKPGSLDRRPVKIDGLPDHNQKREDFQRAMNSFIAREDLETFVDDIRVGKDPFKQLLDLTQDIDEFDDQAEQEITRYNTAYALVALDSANEKLESVRPAKGSGTPKAPGDMAKRAGRGSPRLTSPRSDGSAYLSDVSKRLRRIYAG